MRYTFMGALALLVLLPAAWARDDAKDKPKSDTQRTPADEFSALVKEFDDKQQEVFAAYRTAKTDEERRKVLADLPKAAEYAAKMMKLTQDHPKDAFVPEALVWVIQRARVGPEADNALKLLLTDHIASAKVGDVCQVLRYSGSAQTDKSLRTILEKSPHKDAQGKACLALAQYFKDQSERPGADAREKQTKEAETLLERVAAEYGDVKMRKRTLADVAKAELFEIRNLAIGKVAPEIKGEDLDGKKFKLSDYRGKVVVLDFWGNW